jgi:hypothetical protein
VRSFLLAALVALAAVALALYALRGDRRSERAPPATTAAEEPRTPDIAERAQSFPRAPETQEEVEAFVRACAERGPKAVAELAARLRTGRDVKLQPRWTFDEDGRVRGFPTLRSAYIAALLAIQGAEARDAALEALPTATPEEAYQIAAGLFERGDGGFAAAAFERAASAPASSEVARDLVAFLARAQPDATSAEIVARTPRGEDGRDPVLLAQGLEALPLERAAAAARALVADLAVTRKAKERYLKSFCDRGEPEILANLRAVVPQLDRELRISLAYSAVSSRAFALDEAALAATRGGPGAAEIRERCERRLLEAELLVAEAVPAGEEGADPVLASLRRRLEEKRERLR